MAGIIVPGEHDILDAGFGTAYRERYGKRFQDHAEERRRIDAPYRRLHRRCAAGTERDGRSVLGIISVTVKQGTRPLAVTDSQLDEA